MPTIQNHPGWWMTITLGGLSSHINCNAASEEFVKHRIQIVKEEGDASQVNQACDQHAAKKDETNMKTNFNMVRRKIGNAQIDQFVLMAVDVEAQLKTSVLTNELMLIHPHVHRSLALSRSSMNVGFSCQASASLTKNPTCGCNACMLVEVVS